MQKIIDFIEALRRQPEEVRRSVLLVVTVLITGVIFVIWLAFWSGPSGVVESTPAPTDVLNDAWSSLKATWSDGWGEIKNQANF